MKSYLDVCDYFSCDHILGETHVCVEDHTCVNATFYVCLCPNPSDKNTVSEAAPREKTLTSL